MKIDKFEVECEDRVILRGDLLIPNKPKAVVQFNCGTAVSKEFYRSFVMYLAENGYVVCLWDYRGNGNSSAESLRYCDFCFSDYGLKDMPAIKYFLRSQFPELPFFILGHSVGGQQIGFMNDLNDVKAVINFAVSSGYYAHMSFVYRMKAYFFFYFFTPLSILIKGYVKAKPFGFMENLPKKVALEWRSWVEKEDYLFDDAFFGKSIPKGQFHNFKFPIHIYWTSDDNISNPKNLEAFWKHIQSEKGISFTQLNPEELNLNKIDHFGFFKRSMKKPLWNEVVLRLDHYLTI